MGDLQERARGGLTLVRPELREPVDLVHSQGGVHGRRHILLDLSERKVIGQSGEKLGIRVTGVDTEGEDGTGFPGTVHMHEMHLGL